MFVYKPDLSPFDEHTVIDSLENHLFLIRIDHYFERIRDRYEAVLSKLELQKADRYLRTKDAESFIVRRYFLREILAKCLKVKPEKIYYQLEANKKPRIDGIQFNVSHTKNLVAIALSPFPVGIDVEFIDQNFNFSIIMEDCFSEEEQMLINNNLHSSTNFYTLWTRKEALLKASGEGLSDLKLNHLNALLDRNTSMGNCFQLNSNLVWGCYMVSSAFSSPSKIIHYWTV